MATKILGFGDAFRALAAESGTMRGHPMMNTSVHYAIESDEDAAVLQAEATQDAEEMTTDIAAANEAVELGDSANEAGDVFALAAVDETVPEAMIAQADTVAADVAEAGGVPLTTVLPDITDADRTMSEVSTESSTGRRIRRPMYGAIRQNKAGLQRCAESMWTSAKAIFSNAWDAILKAYRKFCQWVDKYIGTFARLKMKVDSLLKDSKNLDGKKIKSGDNKIEITTGSKNLAVPGETGPDVTYITTGTELIKQVAEMRKEVLYNNIRKTGYPESSDYLKGLEIVSCDYKAVFNQYKDVPGVVFLIDPPYLSTDVGTYNMYWRLSDYLDVLKILEKHSFVYFTSNKSSILELCEWIGANKTIGNPFEGCTKKEFNAHMNYSAEYTDMMLYIRQEKLVHKTAA